MEVSNSGVGKWRFVQLQTRTSLVGYAYCYQILDVKVQCHILGCFYSGILKIKIKLIKSTMLS